MSQKSINTGTVISTVVSLYTLQVVLGIIVESLGFCGGGIGSGLYCNPEFLSYFIIRSEIVVFLTLFLGFPLFLWLIAFILASKNRRLYKNNLNKYTKTFFYINTFDIYTLLSGLLFIILTATVYIIMYS